MNKPREKAFDLENPEWTEQDFRTAHPAADVLPGLFGEERATVMLKPRGRPKVLQPKQHVNLRLDADVLAVFKSAGRGWQTRINRALREWIQANGEDQAAPAALQAKAEPDLEGDLDELADKPA